MCTDESILLRCCSYSKLWLELKACCLSTEIFPVKIMKNDEGQRNLCTWMLRLFDDNARLCANFSMSFAEFLISIFIRAAFRMQFYGNKGDIQGRGMIERNMKRTVFVVAPYNLDTMNDAVNSI